MNTNENTRKNMPNVNTKPVIIDFGRRAIVAQNFSKMISLPKVALQNFGKVSQIVVQFVQHEGERYLKLTPVKGGQKK